MCEREEEEEKEKERARLKQVSHKSQHTHNIRVQQINKMCDSAHGHLNGSTQNV